MEDEPWDELSRPAAVDKQQPNLAHALTVHRSDGRNSGNSPPLPPSPPPPPPVSAFYHRDPPGSSIEVFPDYDYLGSSSSINLDDSTRYRDDEYDEETEAEVHDNRDVTLSLSSSPDKDYNIRQEALKMLEVADDQLAGSPYSVHRTLSGGFTATHKDLEGEFTMKSANIRIPTALSGLSFSTSTMSRYRDDPGVLEGIGNLRHSSTSSRYSDSGNGDGVLRTDEVVDVIVMERRSTSFSGQRPTGSLASSNDARWSSRYSIDSTLLALSGGSVSSSNGRFHDSMDRTHQQERQAARNILCGSEGTRNSGVFGAAGYNYRSKHVFGQQGVTVAPSSHTPSKASNLYVDDERSSLPVLAPRKSWQEQFIAQRKQRRIAIGVAIVLFAIIIALIAVLSSNKAKSQAIPSDSSSFDTTDASLPSIENLVTFYATSDVPYDVDDQEQLAETLSKLSPAEGTFLIHLGNIQNSSKGGCRPDVYSEVASVIRTSPLTTFIVPGQEDWPNCPDPEAAWDAWQVNFTKFEKYFKRDFYVEHQLDHKENFAFVYNGVFFAGIHVVGGGGFNDLYSSATGSSARENRNHNNFEWLSLMISVLTSSDTTAIVIFGNAKPDDAHNQIFFSHMAGLLALKDVPSLYVHASSFASTGNSSRVIRQPFDAAPNVISLQVAPGSSNPPSRISIGTGEVTFLIS